MSFDLPTGLGKGLHIRYKGIVDFKELWGLIRDWFESKGFEVIENKAKHNVKTLGEEFECAMSGWRNITDFYRFEIAIYQKYWDAEWVDVVKDGKQQKLVKARFYFRITGQLVFDYSDRYNGSKFMLAIRNFTIFKVTRWQWDVIYGDQLNYKLLEIQALIKEFLGMKTKGSEFADVW